MNFRISNEFYRFTSPPLKVIEPPPFFVVGVIAALGRSWSPFAPKAQGGEAERERQLGDLTFGVSDWFCDFGGFPGFPSPFFCQGSLVDKLDWLGCVVFWGTVFVEMWMKFRCFVQSWNVIFCRLYTLALEIGSDFIWSRSEIWVCTLKCGRCCSRSAGSIQHSSTFRDDVCLTSDRTKIWKPTSQ